MELEKIDIGKATDISGMRFGKLQVLYRTKNIGKHTAWACKCDCGNIIPVTATHLKGGHTKSCGCYKKNDMKQDLTNQKFGQLLVESYHHSDKNGHTYWNCKCDCGNNTIVRRDALIEGKTLSCGCYHRKEIRSRQTINLVGQRFGKLVVKTLVGYNNNHIALWKCQCDCGNEIITTGVCLRRNEVHSCGCEKSYGEFLISKILRNNNIPFETQKTFEDCIFESGFKAKFDFFIDNKYIIEYDGIQHFQTGTGWNTQEHLDKTQKNDAFKNKWCKEHNIPIIRIPYTHLNNIIIDDLLLETSSFII